MKKLYPSSIGYQDQLGLTTNYPSSCYRMLVAKDNGYSEQIDPKYSELGAADELRFLQELAETGNYSMILWEIPTAININTTLTVSGRCDFLAWRTGEDDPIVFEKKSTMSKGSIYAFRKGEFKINHLSQLISYMLIHEVKHGVLVATGYKIDKNGDTVLSTTRNKEIDDFVWQVRLADDQTVWINGTETSYSVIGIVNYMIEADRHLNGDKMPPKLADESICKWCKLKDICHNSSTRQEFINDIKLIYKKTKDFIDTCR